MGRGAGIEVPAPRPRRAPVLLSAIAALAGVAVLLPLVYLVVRATERGWEPFEQTLWRRRTAELVGRSVTLGASVTVASLVIGIGAAWLVARTDIPLRRFFQVAFALPLAIPSYVAAWAWIGWRPDLAGRTGAVIVLTSISYPYVYLPVLAALRSTDGSLEEVARSLGKRPLTVFLGVTLRQVRIAALGGALLVGLYALSDFGAVSIMRYESLTHVIYRSYRASFDRTPAAVLGCVLVVLTLLVLLGESRVRGRSSGYARVGGGTSRQPSIVRLRAARLPAAIAGATVVGLSVGVPAWSLVYWTRRGRSRTDWSQFFEALTGTLSVAAMATLATLALALPIGYLSARHANRLSRGVTAAAYAGHALPGLIVGLSLVFFGVRYAHALYQRTPMLVFAYVVLFLSLAIGAVHNSIAQVPLTFEDVSRSLGRRQITTWFTITFRLAAPGVGAGGALVFLTVMKELPATLLLRPIGLETLATRLWSHTDAAAYAAAAPYAATIVLLAALPTTWLTGALRGRR